MTADAGEDDRLGVCGYPFVSVIGVDEDEGRGVKPFTTCFDREGTTVRVELVSMLS